MTEAKKMSRTSPAFLCVSRLVFERFECYLEMQCNRRKPLCIGINQLISLFSLICGPLLTSHEPSIVINIIECMFVIEK